MDPNTLKSLIKKAIPDAEIFVEGDGYHYQTTVISDVFKDKSLVERQKLVYKAVSEHIQSGELHALTIKTKTTHEWGLK
ncbi:MAG TPA: BolA/IbaG family iron-sulfur metabolism protein [Gammaproteobacteria bacterium]|nr:BolA/IbaG family iron-sulfur metabolism protein [Gammaproteobacteria bacterium]